MTESNNRPDFELVVWDPARGNNLVAGVGWRNTKTNRINVKLNPGVTLTYFDQAAGGLKLMLRPTDRPPTADTNPKASPPPSTRESESGGGGGLSMGTRYGPPDEEDDIPF
jgi:hypothetical protein